MTRDQLATAIVSSAEVFTLLIGLNDVARGGFDSDAAAKLLRGAGCPTGPVRQVRLPPAPGLLHEAHWVLRHGLPWLGGHLPQVALPALAATVRPLGRPVAVHR